MSKTKKHIVVVIDGGGRGAALVDKYAQSPKVSKIIAIPGNDLMQLNCKKPVETHIELKTTNLKEILEICIQNNVALVDVAQDNAVEAGLVDALIQAGIPAVGPTRLAGQIEWDKAWSREFGQRHGLPQPVFKICNSQHAGLEYIKNQPDQACFIKAAGLAEGKGVLPAKNKQEAIQRISEIARFGKSAEVYLIEKWLQSEDGSSEEFSLFILSDGKNYKIIGSAQDHKRISNHDEGENTGGMGCSSPPLVLTPELLQEIDKKIVKKAIAGLNQEGRPYKGILYLGGILIKEKGKLTPYVIEFNSRWGDPEAQCIIPSINNDFFDIGLAVSSGNINSLTIKTDTKVRVVVAGTSRGYPSDYSQVKGKQIFGILQAKKIKGIKIYGAGVKVENKKHIATGGRLFYIVGEGKNILDARQKAYAAMSLIYVQGNNLHYRTDIGFRDIERIYS